MDVSVSPLDVSESFLGSERISLSPQQSPLPWEQRVGEMMEEMDPGVLHGWHSPAAENFLLPRWLSAMAIMTTFSGILGGWCSKQTLFDGLCAVLEQSLLTSCLQCHKWWSWHVRLVLWCVCWCKNWKVRCLLCSNSLFLLLELLLVWAEPFNSSSGEICCNQFWFSICLSSVVTTEEIHEAYFFFPPLFQCLLTEGETGEQQEVFWSSFAGLLPKAKLNWCLSVWSLACHM